MLASKNVLLGVFLLAGSASGALIAQNPGDFAVPNWTVPPYTRAGAAGGLSRMVDISPGVAFTAIQPCRVVDTRGGAFTGTYGPPIMAAGATRDFDINSAPHCPAIPSGAEAYSLNFTVTQTAGAPGDIRVWPTGNPPPPAQITSVLNWLTPNATIANATIIPAGTGGSITVQVAGADTHLLIDINGYFTDVQNVGQFFEASGSRTGSGVIVGINSGGLPGSSGVRGENSTAGGDQVFGLHGIVSTTGVDAAGVRGEHLGPFGFGVWGSHGGVGMGVRGTSVQGHGVSGVSQDGSGVFGSSTGSEGVRGESFSNSSFDSGVVGVSRVQSGEVYGVRGFSSSSSGDSAGVFGSADEDNAQVTLGAAASKAGVRGESAGFGVLGISESIGAAGYVVNAFGNVLAYGWVGVVGPVDSPGSSPWSFFGNQDIGSPGVKSFVEPHPTDAEKIIQYVALEGPEAGTYFRGRAKFQNGLATIAVPEDFRIVTDAEGLTVQITPIGEMASFAVVRMGLDQIVVKASRNVEFSYLVQGVRRAFKERTPIRVSSVFAPQRPDSKLDESLSPELKRRLVANGSYNADGSANLDTARRLGWDEVWEKREQPAASSPPESR